MTTINSFSYKTYAGWEHGFLSNFFILPEPMFMDGIGYPTSEHAYQAMKTTSRALREHIALAPSPAKAKYAGRRVPLRPDWDIVKDDEMREVLRVKFQHQRLAESLVGTHPATLIEGNTWHDNYWGDCSCPRCPEGKNMLGQLLMELRSSLMPKMEMF